ncbi:hypothetical protein BDV12DRAFT_201130 [Aspergillus spectabilis]
MTKRRLEEDLLEKAKPRYSKRTKKQFKNTDLLVWRPLVSHLRDWPLALCDMRTVSREDIVEADLISPGFQGENMFLYFSPHPKFYFRDRQSPDEVWIFKQFDSMDGVAKHCPHGSFQNPDAAADEPRRMSIDVAALVIY